MKPRLNVTEDERLCYSRRALSCISALRNAGLDTGCILHGKDHIPGRRGRWYSLVMPYHSVLFFSRLTDVIALAEEYRTYTTTMLLLERDERISWQRWQNDGTAYALSLLISQLRAIVRQDTCTGIACVWPDCRQEARYAVGEERYCTAHYHVVSAMLRERTA